MYKISVWGYNIPNQLISESDINYLIGLPKNIPTVEWVWQEMDRIWYSQDLDNKRPFYDQSISNYYSHPVWLMNGIFTALDPTSKSHRMAIAKHISKNGFKIIADYGGGFGELALSIANTNPDVSISIIEPYPSKVGLDRVSQETKINFLSKLDQASFDVVIAQDVLEHVEDPIGLAYQLAQAVHINGHVIFANCFYPVIQCHLPKTFHLRHTFPWVMKAMGLLYIGKVKDAEHALIFERVGQLNLTRARSAEAISKVIGSVINNVRSTLSKIKKLIIAR